MSYFWFKLTPLVYTVRMETRLKSICPYQNSSNGRLLSKIILGVLRNCNSILPVVLIYLVFNVAIVYDHIQGNVASYGEGFVPGSQAALPWIGSSYYGGSSRLN